MAQRTEDEETEFKVTLCVNNCGNPATSNMCQCQSCFSASSAAPQIPRIFSTPPRSTTSSRRIGVTVKVLKDPQSTLALNRCSGCRRKVGLTGFRCRCGDLFCADHRYSDRHVCTYDYKTAGREAIARENPVVKAAKIIKV